jgi:hypothetical protein
MFKRLLFVVALVGTLAACGSSGSSGSAGESLAPVDSGVVESMAPSEGVSPSP